ncbi:uncharacterized protein HKW66_Vig0234690 [Vigna angularis]|uniref:WIYLD domain-containing protein n=1 Tax=Phaseolus angularis TaxID=3914 RepID=A0A8T0KVL2_PHAAN|nr:uncharacterized protein LOC108343871 [Vigna angularis]KAG2402273.1 uncharacterized protein HKW66_Vig0234690 [Vigna angularis]
MAPKRRPTKVGESRMDAALDAMHIYGFSKKLVRTTVQSLLKVYGGNEGWVFIEDSSYTLLIDTLLESQLNPSPPVVGLIEANPGDGPNEVTPAGCSNGALLACCKTQTSDDKPLTIKALQTLTVTSETGSQLPIKSVDTLSSTSGTGSVHYLKSVGISSENRRPANELLIKAASETPIKAVPISAEKKTGSQLPIKSVDNLSPTSGTGRVHYLKSVDISSENRRQANELLIKAASETPIKAVTISAEKKSESQPAGNLALRENHGPKIPQLNHKRRRPCYGWISSDEENEDLTELIPKYPL